MKTALVLLIGLFVSPLTAQIVERPTSCELANSYLNLVLQKAVEGDLLIVIAHSGSKEREKTLNSRRLANVKTYLTKYISNSFFSTNPQNLILAAGDPTPGTGYLELFFRGKPLAKLYVGPNQDLYIGECVVDLEEYKSVCEINAQKDFYPCLDKSKRNRR